MTDFTAFGNAKRKQLQLFLDVGDTAAHQPLHGVDRALGMVDQSLRAALPTISRALASMDTTLGTSRVAVLSRNDFRPRQIHAGDQAVGGAEVDADYPLSCILKINLEHGCVLSIRFVRTGAGSKGRESRPSTSRS